MSCQDIFLLQQGGNDLKNDSIKSFVSGSDTIFGDRSEIRSVTKQQRETIVPSIPISPSLQVESRPFLVPCNLDVISITQVFRACLGSMYLEKASSAQLNYTAYEDHCRSTMRHLEQAGALLTTYQPLDKAVFLDVLQMIRCGLHKDEVVATLQQRIISGPNGIRSIGESVDRIASLVAMVEIGDVEERGYDSRFERVPWTHGNLKDTISNYFSGQTVLSDTGIRLDSAFTTKNLAQIARFRISWTANLADHLLLDAEQKVMHVFHHVTFLECQRKR